jgi:hypothetical protein
MKKLSRASKEALSRHITTDLIHRNPNSARGWQRNDGVSHQSSRSAKIGLNVPSTTAAWVLHALSLDQDLQDRLRTELRSSPLPVQNDDYQPLSPEEYASLSVLPLLDAVVREALRLFPPVSSVVRVAVQDDVVPVAKPFKDRHGVMCDSIRYGVPSYDALAQDTHSIPNSVKKDEPVFVPILLINRSKELWGEDAHEFRSVSHYGILEDARLTNIYSRSDRWLNSDSNGRAAAAASSIPGIFANILSFIGGPRACIGWRFAVLEYALQLQYPKRLTERACNGHRLKIILHVLITSFILKPAVDDIGRNVGIVERPCVKSEPKKGAQLPLVIERALVH